MANEAKGSIIHVELPARDIESAAAFYADLFGWRINRSPDYVGFRPPAGPGGGFNQLAGENASTSMPIEPGDVLIYISCDDIDATLARARALGGETIVPRKEIPGAGWFAILADPTGNRVGLLHFIHDE